MSSTDLSSLSSLLFVSADPSFPTSINRAQAFAAKYQLPYFLDQQSDLAKRTFSKKKSSNPENKTTLAPYILYYQGASVSIIQTEKYFNTQ